MGDPVDLQPEVGPLLDGDDPVLATIADDPALVVADDVDGALHDRRALDPVTAWAGPVDSQLVVVTTVMKLDLGADAFGVGGPAARGGGEKRRIDHAAVGLVGLNGSGDDRHGVGGEGEGTRGELLVEPRARVGHVVGRERAHQGEEAGAVAGPEFEDDRGAVEGTVEPVEGFGPVASPGSDRRDERFDPAVDGVAFADARVDPHAGADRESEELENAARGDETAQRVLGKQPDLDGVAGGRGRLRVERPPGGELEPQPDEAGARRLFEQGSLGARERVDPEEPEGLPVVAESELDRAGALVCRGAHESARGMSHRSGCRVRHLAGGHLREDLGRSPADARIPQPESPHGALVIGEDVDVDAAPRGAIRACRERRESGLGGEGVELLRVRHPLDQRRTRTDDGEAAGLEPFHEFDSVEARRVTEPHGLGAGLKDRAGDCLRRQTGIRVGPRGGRWRSDDLVGLTRIPRTVAALFGHHDRRDRGLGAAVEIADGGEHPDNGLTSVDNGQAADLLQRNAPIVRCSMVLSCQCSCVKLGRRHPAGARCRCGAPWAVADDTTSAHGRGAPG